MVRGLSIGFLTLCAFACAEPSSSTTREPPPAATASAGASVSETVADGAPHDTSPRASDAVTLAPDAASPAPPGPRLYVRTHSLPIHPDGALKGASIGALAAGESVALRDEPPHAAAGCAVARAIEPRGWVCIDNGSATLDPTDTVWVALQQHAPNFSSALPYSYGESRGTRRQRSLPDVVAPAWPPSLFEPRIEIPPRSTVAWTDEVQSGGAPWVRAADMSFVQKDQIVPFARVDFHGIALGDDVSLPVAFFKRVAHTQYKKDANGRFAVTGDTWPRLSWVALSGKNEKRSGRTFWETKDGQLWLDARDAAVVAPGDPGPDGRRSTWIEVAALAGWLVAYEHERPVYATLISAGKLGAAKPDPDRSPHQPPATTPIGSYRVREKLLTTTLQSELDDGVEFVHNEVPWSQRFQGLYLLHTAYWHDQWGEGHSGGCVNLAPSDAKWLFEWTEPRLPDGWHSVRVKDNEPSTAIVIHP
jgi:hypothetical protein